MDSAARPTGDRDIGEALGCNEAILGVCAALLGDMRLDAEERKLLKTAAPVDGHIVERIVELVGEGEDPLGDAFMAVNRASERRGSGSVYTPRELVESMVRWSASKIQPGRVVDCGCGSGRFAVASARMFPEARVLAVDVSPMATLMCKAHAIAAGVEVAVSRRNFTKARLPYKDAGATLWIGNPPYVRHHDIDAGQKDWYASMLKRLGLKGSTLAGLHHGLRVLVVLRGDVVRELVEAVAALEQAPVGDVVVELRPHHARLLGLCGRDEAVVVGCDLVYAIEMRHGCTGEAIADIFLKLRTALPNNRACIRVS